MTDPTPPAPMVCEKCGLDPSHRWHGNREQICGASPTRARQPMWACRFGSPLVDAYHASHEHEHGRCVV